MSRPPNVSNIFIASSIIVMMVVVILAANNINEEKVAIKNNCKKTSLVVYVGGRVNDTSPVYDCGENQL